MLDHTDFFCSSSVKVFLWWSVGLFLLLYLCVCVCVCVFTCTCVKAYVSVPISWHTKPDMGTAPLTCRAKLFLPTESSLALVRTNWKPLLFSGGNYSASEQTVPFPFFFLMLKKWVLLSEVTFLPYFTLWTIKTILFEQPCSVTCSPFQS